MPQAMVLGLGERLVLMVVNEGSRIIAFSSRLAVWIFFSGSLRTN